MKAVTIAAAKGGCTKSTVTLSLAVAAAQDKKRVALFDLDGGQGDLTKWWKLRGRFENTDNPKVEDVEHISKDIDLLRTHPKAPYDWLFIDGPPSDLDITENAILKSDAVIIPVRPSFFDVDAVTPIVEMCNAWGKPFSFLLSAVDTKMPKLAESAMTALLTEKNAKIFATRLRYLQPYILSLNKGRSAAEIDKSCEPEIRNLWTEVQSLAATPETFMAVRGRAAS